MMHQVSTRQTAALFFSVLSVLALGVLGVSRAEGQLSPERLYNGINRPIAMTVARPPGETGDLSIRLLEPVSATVLHTAPVKEGPVNLASTFPHLWQEPTPRLVYAQLYSGEHPVGAAVVMQPMEGPRVAQLRQGEAKIDWIPQRARAFTGYRCYIDRVAVVETTAGPIEFIMRPEVAPNTVFNFLHLADNGFYTDILVHRIVPRRADGAPFVIQFGDPTGSGVGTPGYHIDLERSTLQHTYGVLSMARSEDPNTNGSQVFICLSREGTEGLDGSYCAFAQAISGAEAIAALSQTSVDAQGRPTTDPPPLVRTVRLADAPPYGTAPRPITRPVAPTSTGDR